jgi:hypothetical protein
MKSEIKRLSCLLEFEECSVASSCNNNCRGLTEVPIGCGPVAEEEKPDRYAEDDPEQLDESEVIKFDHL